MVRPLEGMGAPLKVRFELMQMFERWLSRPRHPDFFLRAEDFVDEQSILELSQHYRLEYPGGTDDVANTWDESEQRIADGGPTFDELISSGWVFFDGGRWIMQSTPLGAFSHITYPSPSTKTFLEGLGKARLVAKTGTQPSDVQALAARILVENWLERHIPTKNPNFIAGRLWERLCPKQRHRTAENSGSANQAATSAVDEDCDSSALIDAEAETVDRAFLEWSAWCHVLGSKCRWDIHWGDIEKQYCREAAHRALGRQTLWGTWDNDAARYADVLENTFMIPQERLRYGWAARKGAPKTLVYRVDWLKLPEVEHLIMERLIDTNTASFAFGLLCSELEKTGTGPRIMTDAAAIISFAADHPIALQLILFRVNAVPALLVDLLLHPLAACMAARLVIEWQQEGLRDSDRILTREAQTKAFAVNDALSLLAYHLDVGKLDLEEYAALVTWCYGDSSARWGGTAAPDSRRPIGRQLLELVARGKEGLQSLVLQHLVEQASYEDNLPRARFAGVLEGLGSLPDARGADASAIVALYTKFARDLHLSWTDANSLSAELAAQLIATALKQSQLVRDALLVPFDSAKLLREAPDEEKASLRSSIAQTLREHVRLLARAADGWPDEVVPSELADAFQALVSRSIIEHDEKGRVGALTDRYSPNSLLVHVNEEGSPAQDIVAAWRRLDSDRQAALLRVLTQSDDPVLLAELCQHLPAAAKSAIQARLRDLKPGEASRLWTWTGLQHRIESLLIAGECGLAREYLDEAQENLDRAAPQFRLGLFGLELRLLLKEKNWAALDDVVVPSELDAATTRQAQDQVAFYKATSQLLRPNGNLQGARDVLQRLAASPGAASAYKENVFAVAVQQILGPTLHPLTGADKVTGEGLLAEIDAAIASNKNSETNSLLANRALLLLALQRPEDAFESVAARRRETRNLNFEWIAVLAKSEMGFRHDAMAILDRAITEFGTDDRLIALKNELQAGESMSSLTSATVVVDQISSIRGALQQLAELLPSQVGDILGPPGGGLRGYLIRHVSRAVAALQHMAAMLRDRKSSEKEARFEDDLNTAVREVLNASLAVVKWDVSDQSLGGSTTNGNPGERDAVIRASGQEISIYEALVCSGVDRSNIKKHFDKLLSYGVCDIYFHVTYSYAKNLEPLLKYVEHMLEHEIPAGLRYLRHEPLGPPDYETSGYLATYSADHRDIAVVFFIADLGTSRPRLAEDPAPTA